MVLRLLTGLSAGSRPSTEDTTESFESQRSGTIIRKLQDKLLQTSRSGSPQKRQSQTLAYHSTRDVEEGPIVSDNMGTIKVPDETDVEPTAEETPTEETNALTEITPLLQLPLEPHRPTLVTAQCRDIAVMMAVLALLLIAATTISLMK